MSDFGMVLEQFRKQAISERDKGFKFERLMRAYLLTDPKYTSILKEVWLWSDFPSKIDMGGKDTGIDLVALTHTGEYWAIQCKCYQENASISKASVDSFLATSSKEFIDTQTGKTTKFAQRVWISTT